MPKNRPEKKKRAWPTQKSQSGKWNSDLPTLGRHSSVVIKAFSMQSFSECSWNTVLADNKGLIASIFYFNVPFYCLVIFCRFSPDLARKIKKKRLGIFVTSKEMELYWIFLCENVVLNAIFLIASIDLC